MTAHLNRKKPTNSLMARIEAFFRANPDEWLTWADMAVKFDCTEQQAQRAMETLRLGGRLEWERVSMIRLVGAS